MDVESNGDYVHALHEKGRVLDRLSSSAGLGKSMSDHLSAPFPDEQVDEGGVEIIVRVKDKKGHVVSEKLLEGYCREDKTVKEEDTLKEVQGGYEADDFLVVDFLNDLMDRMDEHTDLEALGEFIDMVPVSEEMSEQLYSPAAVQDYVKGIQRMLEKKGCAKISDVTL